jgi:hypothetical protein
MTAPYFTDVTGPIDFYDESDPEVAAIVVDAVGNHHGAGGRFVSKQVEYERLQERRERGPWVPGEEPSWVTVFDLPDDPREAVRYWDKNRTTLVAYRTDGSTRDAVVGDEVLEDTPQQVIRRRQYAAGRVVWTVRPRVGFGRIEVYEAGEPRFADLETEWRRRSAAPERPTRDRGFAAYEQAQRGVR